MKCRFYITEEDGCKTAVHNAFDSFDVLDAFSRGEAITSITGREYDALDFCGVVEYAAGRSDISISAAEIVLGSDKKRKETVKKMPFNIIRNDITQSFYIAHINRR